MLHTESGKGGAQDNSALTALLKAVLTAIVPPLVLAACTVGGHHHEDAESTSAQLFALNAPAAREHLGLLISACPDSLQADRMATDYYRREGEWLWAETPDLLAQGSAVAERLKRQARANGFAPEAFCIPEIEADMERLDSLRFDSVNTQDVVMARTELNLTRAYLRCTRGQRYGFMNPMHTLNRLDLRDGQPGNYRQTFDISIEQPDSLFAVRALRQAAEGRALEFIDDSEPRDPVYRQMAEALRTDSTDEGRRRLMCNMERRRWRTKTDPTRDDRYVFVNIPAQQLWAVSPDTILNMRICCGAWKTKTPLLHSELTRIEVNPEWVIPPSIVRDDVSRHAGDSAYFARNRYVVTSRQTGDTIEPKAVSREQLLSGRYRVAQLSGRGNALGRLIFRFPNQHAVYLHDTNNHGAFNAERRTISHGCIRVQRPFELARFLLPGADDWLIDRIRLSIDMRPETDRGRNLLRQRQEEGNTTPIRLLTSTPVTPGVNVYISYYTVYPNPLTGELEVWPDRYEYDKQILKSLKPYL